MWGLFRNRFATPQEFFKSHFVINYCPLGFFDQRGINLTPDKLPKNDREPLLDLCDEYLGKALSTLKPRFAIGVGRFAESRLEAVLGKGDLALAKATVIGILHPSPASPAANQGWEAKVTHTLVACGMWR